MKTRLSFISVVGFVMLASGAEDKQTVPPAGDASAFIAATNIVVTRYLSEKHKEERFAVNEPYGAGSRTAFWASNAETLSGGAPTARRSVTRPSE
jgi:hypothetical protein